MSPIRIPRRHPLAPARRVLVPASPSGAPAHASASPLDGAPPRAGRAADPARLGHVAALAVTLLVGLLGAVSPALAAGDTPAADEAEAAAPRGEVLVASSTCEAHELRFRKEQDPSLNIEIPPEYAGQWPSRNACVSAAKAWDPEAPGPLQPIPFSHKHHAGDFGIDCQYCHSNTDESPAAGVPSVELCMGCHAQFPPTYDEIEGIRILKQHWEEKKPIEWNQIHRLPEHVQFRHNRHIAVGVACQRCHGPVQEMDKVYLVPDGFWKYGVPVKKLEMGWCINCHRENEAQIDCLRCHY